jgi:hypothetical protein
MTRTAKTPLKHLGDIRAAILRNPPKKIVEIEKHLLTFAKSGASL